MDHSENLALPYIMPSQAQKHVTHNEAIRALDAIVQLSALDNSHSAPPASPADGSRYIVADGATGEWAGRENQVAAWQDGAWAFYEPVAGWVCWMEAASALLVFDGSAWQPANGAMDTVPMLGVNATADPVNRVIVSAAATLLTHEGAGHQLKLNKAGSSETGSLVFQTGFAGHAEMGLAGDDDFHIKVSPDGLSWVEALRIDRASGAVLLPQTPMSAIHPNLLINGDFRINQRGFAGGVLADGAYGYDRWKAVDGPADVTLSGYAVTLDSGTLAQIVEPSTAGTDSLAGTILTVSVESPSADLAVSAGSSSATIPAGAGRQSATLTTDAGDTGNLMLKISAAGAGSISFGRVKLEAAPSPSQWSARPFPQELSLCQRYFQTTVPYGQNPATYAPGAGNGSIYAIASPSGGSVTVVRLAVPMRAVPTVKIRDGAANLGRISAFDGTWLNDFAYTGVLGVSDKGFSLQQNNAGLYNISFDYDVDAESV
ncbi:DUF2793 domain-containing protein [Hoeflea sp.]|uniref:DUF2793 domain-containing protein n=1 Tax=Hoeflea sp. TaxID=1940281 RepID=UPI003B528834